MSEFTLSFAFSRVGSPDQVCTGRFVMPGVLRLVCSAEVQGSSCFANLNVSLQVTYREVLCAAATLKNKQSSSSRCWADLGQGFGTGL